MANELTRVEGAWVTVGAGLGLTADTFVQASASDLLTLLADTVEDYPEFEARLQVTMGTPIENDFVEVHLRMGDGTNQEPAPGGDFAPHNIGGILLDGQTGYYFADGLPLLNKNSQIYLKSPTTVTATLSIRAKSLAPAA